MSGIKDEDLRWFYRRLHRRGEDAGTLADAIVSGRTHVTEVLNGTVDSSRTRARLAKMLDAGELALLGWDVDGTIVPRVAKSDGRHLKEASASPLLAAASPVQVHLSSVCAEKGGL